MIINPLKYIGLIYSILYFELNYANQLSIKNFGSSGWAINPLASPSAGAPALKYGDVNTVTPSPGEVKGLILFFHFI